MRVFILVAAVTMAATANGQTTGAQSNASKAPPPAAAAKPGAASLTPASLRTEGLNFGDDLTSLYIGDFAQVGFPRDGTALSILVSHYMNTFSRECAGDLPKDKVEIMTQECAREAWTENGYGIEQPGSRHCVDYRTRGTGRYADPEVYRLHTQLGASTTRSMMGSVFGAMKPGGDPAGAMRRMTDLAVYARDDMPKLVQANGCASPALKRWQANLVRFGEGKDPIVMPGGAAALAQKGPSAESPLKDQNYERLIDDLITEQSQAWMMNRYQPGSVRPGVPTRDTQGRPREIVAGYSFVSTGKSYSGRVRVTFLEGIPQCLYFSDLPDSCRVPSPRVISAYRKNQYAGAPSPEPASRAATVAPAVVRPPEVAVPAQSRPAARPDPADDIAPPQPAQARVPAPPPDGERATPAREDAQEARAAALLERQAAARERRCALLRSSIDRARESAAKVAPQRAEHAEARVDRAELSYAKLCNP